MTAMRRLSAIITMLLLATLPMFALSYHAVNVDKVTAAAMTAAYASEAEMEAMNTSNLQKIVDHYKSATVATAGIYYPRRRTGMPCVTLAFLRLRKTTITSASSTL